MAKPTKKKAGRKPPASPAFRKYTNLAAAIDMLQNKHIRLLDPATWDDKNDSWFLQEYRDIVGAKAIFATCFAETDETYHHWRVFSAGAGGVCIEFDKGALLTTFKGSDVKKGKVKYLKISTLRGRSRIEPEELPFLKRHPYKPECEYRVLFLDKTNKKTDDSKAFRIELAWIKRVTLSPWMPASLRASVISTLKKIPDCEHLKVVRSTLVSNREWRAFTDKAR